MSNSVEIPAGIDKSARSVFVGNIPYEATEEKLKDIFSEVGPVTSFKLVYDRENGKPKGYGFCEYKDADMALSAMRNLNGYEIGGRTLRVDNACTERSRMEMASSTREEEREESPYGEPVHPERAAETIANAVASLSPEQMYQIMIEMKACVVNNPDEARRILSQNPQLTYALLQIQVVMRAIDPEMAVTVLHPNPPPTPRFQDAAPSALYKEHKPPSSAHPSSSSSTSSRNRDRDYGHRDFRDPRARSSRDRKRDRSREKDRERESRRKTFDDRPAPFISNLNEADPEKAQLIMQVLQLTDQQIAMLPSDQRQSIMELKQQMNPNQL